MKGVDGLEVEIGDALAVSEFTTITKVIKARFNAGPNRRFVMLLLGEQGDDEKFDPEAMLNALGWEKNED